MKYVKRLPLHTRDPMSKLFAVELDGHIVTNSTSSFQVPNGPTAGRPIVKLQNGVQNGDIRYNTDLGTGGELEAYIDNKWQIIKTNRQQVITQATFEGNYLNTIFGPLPYDIDITKPQNIMVFVENVYQIPTTNYTLAYSTSSAWIEISANVITTFSNGEIQLTSIANFEIGNIVKGNNVPSGSTVTSIDYTGTAITLFPAPTQPISAGTTLRVDFATGTYIVFSQDVVPPPTKPITVLLGLDGYGPPFEV